MALKLALLGKPKIEFEGEDVNGRLPVKARILFYYLANNPQTHDRGQLAEWMWNGAANPRGSLRVALKSIRNHLGGNIITATRGTVAINREHDYVLDVEEFDNLIQLAGKVVGATERAHLRDAIEIYRGDFLEDVIIDETFLYDEWLLLERERLRQQALAAYDRLVEMSREQGDYEAGIRYAQALLQVEPWRESAHRHLMWIYNHLGRRAHALNQFDLLEEVLAEKFDVSPTEESFALYRQIASGEVAEEAATESEKPGAPFLAPKLAPFFSGRDAELADLQEKLLPQAKRRLIGLVGPPGVGKSALAIELAHRLRDAFPDGVLWMNADLDDPMSVAERWATAYDHDYSRISDLNERTAVLRDLLAEKRALIICDEVTNAAKTRPFLPEKGQSTILLTSRSENLIRRLGAELVIVPVMSLVNGRALLASIITEERVAAEEDAAAEIIALLEGLPLAIAIAGQRLAQQSRRKLALFAAQLGDESARIDLADRDRAIRTSFTVSWNGLDQIQQGVFARLSVFAGRSFAVDVVTAIAEMDYFEALDRLDALVALSLLNDVGDERYRQHALLADFAREKMGDDDNPYRRMIAYYQVFAAGHNEDYAALELEWENLSASIEQAYQLTMWPTVITLTDTLRPAWFTRGRYAEARLAFPRMEEAAYNCENKPTTAACLLHWGCACNEQSDYEEAAQLLSRSLRIFEEIRNQPGIADAKFELARIAIEQMNLDEADILLADVHQMRKELGDPKGTASVLYRQARVAYRRDDMDLTIRLLQEALSIQEKFNDQVGSMPVLRLLAMASTGGESKKMRDFAMAEECYRKVLNLSEELGDQNERALALWGLSRVNMEQENFQAALQCAQESLGLLQNIGDRKSEIFVRRQIGKVKAKMGEYDEAFQIARKCLELSREFKDELVVGFIQYEMGEWYEQLNKSGLASKHFNASLKIGQSLTYPFLINKSREKLSRLNKK